MTDGGETRRDESLKSANRKVQSEPWDDSRRNPDDLCLAEYVAVSEFLSKAPERC